MATKILLYDVETTPLISYNWGIWQQNAIQVKHEWYILSFAYKWLGDKKVVVKGLCDYKGYKPNQDCDKKLCIDLKDLLDEADIVIGHNSDKFDNKKVNTRMLFHGLKPPSPYRKIDTLKLARNNFKFTSNRLDDLCRFLKIGKKMEHKGIQLWFDCMAGQRQAWRSMKDYNKVDIDLLEQLYFKLRPWCSAANVATHVDEDDECCTKCGSRKLIKRGFSYSNACKYQRYQCTACGGYSRAKRSEKGFGNFLRSV